MSNIDEYPRSQGIAASKYIGETLAVRNRDIVPNLKAQRRELEQRIEKIDLLMSLLEKNADFVKMYDLMRDLV